MKKAIIITPFDNYSYQVRIKYVEQYLYDRGYEVKVISSDFDHRNKTMYVSNRFNLELIHVPQYRKNLSYARIISHRVFAKKVFEKMESLNPDLIYCSAPPNFLFKYTSKYKKKYPIVKLIYELGDLWPETLPLRTSMKRVISPALSVWASLRNNNIGFADGIIYECDMFSKIVSKNHLGVYSKVIYLCKEDVYKGEYIYKKLSFKPFRFAYVGSINNIIDINLIVSILKSIAEVTTVELVIIGGGENADKLISLCDEAMISYENHGIVYDEIKKHNILCTCHFGLNIMKDNVAVGATMKSLEYFHEGLIIINNIKADTHKIVDEYKCGFNIDSNNDMDDLIAFIKNIDDRLLEEKSRNSRRAYDDLFSEKAVEKMFKQFFDKLGV